AAWSSTKALIRGLSVSMRASGESASSSGDSFRLRISAACSVADSQFGSLSRIDGLRGKIVDDRLARNGNQRVRATGNSPRANEGVWVNGDSPRANEWVWGND